MHASKNNDHQHSRKKVSVRIAPELYDTCRPAFGLCSIARMHTCCEAHRPQRLIWLSVHRQSKCEDSAAFRWIIRRPRAHTALSPPCMSA